MRYLFLRVPFFSAALYVCGIAIVLFYIVICLTGLPTYDMILRIGSELSVWTQGAGYFENVYKYIWVGLRRPFKVDSECI